MMFYPTPQNITLAYPTSCIVMLCCMKTKASLLMKKQSGYYNLTMMKMIRKMPCLPMESGVARTSIICLSPARRAKLPKESLVHAFPHSTRLCRVESFHLIWWSCRLGRLIG